MTAGLIFAIISSLAWAGFDATRKGLSTRIDDIPLVLLLCAGQLPLFAYLFVAHEGPLSIESGYLMPAIVTVTLNIAANLLFVRAVRISPLSVTIPMLSFTPVATALAAFILMGEQPTILQLVGISVIVVGAFGLNLEMKDVRHPLRILRSIARERGAILMLIVAVLWSITSTVDKMGVERSSLAFHALIQLGGVTAGLAILLAARRKLHTLKAVTTSPLLLIAAILFGTAALGFQLAAYAELFVSLVEALKRAIGMTAAVIIGLIFFRERVTLIRTIAVAVMIAGTALLLLYPDEGEGTLDELVEEPASAPAYLSSTSTIDEGTSLASVYAICWSTPGSSPEAATSSSIASTTTTVPQPREHASSAVRNMLYSAPTPQM